MREEIEEGVFCGCGTIMTHEHKNLYQCTKCKHKVIVQLKQPPSGIGKHEMKQVVEALRYLAYERTPIGEKIIDIVDESCQMKVIEAIKVGEESLLVYPIPHTALDAGAIFNIIHNPLEDEPGHPHFYNTGCSCTDCSKTISICARFSKPDFHKYASCQVCSKCMGKGCNLCHSEYIFPARVPSIEEIARTLYELDYKQPSWSWLAAGITVQKKYMYKATAIHLLMSRGNANANPKDG